jgi:hypothetical protein
MCAKEVPNMPDIIITFDVDGVDPTKVDPVEVAEYLLGLYDDDARANGRRFILAENHLEAEWSA